MKNRLCIVTYNIRHAHDVATDIGCIGRMLANAGADIVGLQEVDVHTRRMNEVDTLLEIAKGGGYPYYYFAKAMDFDGGGYGTGIVSRYPIASAETVMLFSGREEPRALCHALIQTEVGDIDFFNTHISYESRELRAHQLEQIGACIARCKSFILTGDFNTADPLEFVSFPPCTAINQGAYASFYETGDAIDNIFLSADFSVLQKFMPTVRYSDHYPIFAEVTKA